MTEDKKDKTSEDARTGPNADKNREELKKGAEKGLKDARDDLPRGEG